MNRVLKILFLSIATITVCAVKAQTVMWSIPPTYDSVEEYAPGMYLCTQDEKQGIIFEDNSVLVPVGMDGFTDIVENKSLAYSNMGQLAGTKFTLYKVMGIVDIEKKTYVDLSSKQYFLNTPCSSMPHFSEGLLRVYSPVEDTKGVSYYCGYVNEQGDVVINFEWDEGYPFNSGIACVERKGQVFYIKPNAKYLPVEFHHGKLTYGTSFNSDGHALVGYGMSLAFIDTYGRYVEDFKGTFVRDTINVYDHSVKVKNQVSKLTYPNGYTPKVADAGVSISQANELYGYNIGDDMVIPVQFECVDSFRGGYAKVKHNAKWGLLKMVSDKVSITPSTKTVIQERGKDPTSFDFTLDIPNVYNSNDLKVRFDNGSGNYEDIALSNAGNGSYTYSCTPSIVVGNKHFTTRYEVWYGDLLLVENKSIETPIEYPISIHISNVTTKSTNADENDCQYVVAKVTNNTAIPVTASISISATSQIDNEGGVKTVAAPTKKQRLESGRSTYIEVPCTVYTSFKSMVNVTVSVDGKPAGNKPCYVELTPFY